MSPWAHEPAHRMPPIRWANNEPHRVSQWERQLFDEPAVTWLTGSSALWLIQPCIRSFRWVGYVLFVLLIFRPVATLRHEEATASEGFCTYCHFNFPSQMENKEWKMDTHFPFTMKNEKWKMGPNLPFFIFQYLAKIENSMSFPFYRAAWNADAV